MPTYPWLYSNDIDVSLIKKKFKVMQILGVPYSDDDVVNSETTLKAQAKSIRDELVAQGASAEGTIETKEIVALIAYMQRLGTDIKAK